MAQNKTTENENSVSDYVAGIKDEQKQNDVAAIIKLISKETGLRAKMWGTGIVGFGSYHYKYESGREGDAPLAGLASRVSSIVLYLATDKDTLLKKLGTYKKVGGCIHIKRLADIDKNVLAAMAQESIVYKGRRGETGAHLSS